MKKQKQLRLSFRRETVVVLSRRALGDVAGGAIIVPRTEPNTNSVCDQPIDSMTCPSDAIGCKIEFPTTLGK